MARQSNAAYWAQRMKNMEEALLDHSYTYVENLDRQFANAVQEIEKDIAVWYQRFADNNDISLADAKKLLTSGELKELQWTVDEYIKFGKENALDGAWIKQLENASAKVHISRLDALKLQIQQQAEVLHAQVEAVTEKAAREIYEAGYYHTGFEVQRGIGLGWSLAAIDEKVISKVLSRPWTADGQTFRDRCWTNKQSLVNTVNQEITRMVIRGEAPDRAISNISKKFDVSRQKAGRLVMTESAYFSSTAQKDCYGELDVEEYKIVESLDTHTCELCGSMDGKVFKRSEYAVGLTAPPFHPWCRGCTCPHFADMDGIGERYARDAVTGERFKVPKDMTYEQWRAKQNELYGAGTVEKLRAMSYNESGDKAQFENYKKRLGADAPRSFKDFQNLKYNDKVKYDELTGYYRYKGKNPDSGKGFFDAEQVRQSLVSTGAVRAKGTVIAPPSGFIIGEGNTHAVQRLAERGITLEDAQGFVDNAVFALKQQKGAVYAFYSANGFAAVDTDGLLRTAGHLDEKGQKLFDEAVKQIEKRK